MSGTRPPAPPRRSTLLAVVIVLCLVWGSTWFVIRTGLEDLPPFTSAGVRFALAAGVMAVLARLLGKAEGGTRPCWRLVLAMGGLNFAASYGIVYWAEQRLPSGLVALLWAVFPMLMASAGHVWLGERLRGRQWGGFALGLAGVAVLFQNDLRDLGPGARTAGAVLLISPLVSTAGTVVVKRLGAGVSSLYLNRAGMCLGAILLLACGLLFERDAPADWSSQALASVIYLALAGTVLTFGLYFWAMRYAPAHQLSLIAYVTPAIALGLGATLGDEPLGASTALGGLLILGGVLAVLLSPRRGQGRAPHATDPAPTPDPTPAPDPAPTPGRPTDAQGTR